MSLKCRALSHQVEGEKRRAAASAAAKQQAAGGGGWFGWFRGAPAAKPEGEEPPEAQGELSDEEKEHLRQLVTEQEDALNVGESKGAAPSARLRSLGQ